MHDFAAVSHAVYTFTSTLPQFTERRDRENFDDGPSSTLALSMTAGYAAQIQLQSVFPEADPVARQTRLSAARAVMSVVHGVENVDPHFLHVFLGVSLYLV